MASDLSPTFYNVDYMNQGGYKSQADLYKAVYNLWKAVAAICNNLDVDNGTLGTDFMSTIGTDLNTAMTNFKAPASGPTT